jgi:hypothetical protein
MDARRAATTLLLLGACACGARSTLGLASTGSGGESGGPGTAGSGPCADEDGDGSLSMACGGDDCDDGNAGLFPGAPDFAPGDPPWSVETVDAEGRSGYVSSIALDAGGALHASYWAAPFFPDGPIFVRHATAGARGWSIETVAELDSGFGYTALALDTLGEPRIAYSDTDVVRYARRQAGRWSSDLVSDPEWATQDVSLALDAEGAAYLVYHGSNSLQFGTDAGGAFSVTQLGDGFFTGLGARIARAPSGALHVVYRGPGLHHASRPDAESPWSFETIDSSASYDALALDAAAIPHVAYVGLSEIPEIRLASRASGTWTIEAVAAPGGDLGYVALALDPAGAAHICYEEFADGPGTLYYATNAAGTWVSEGVPGEPPYGSWCAIAVDAAGNVHLTYVGGDYDFLHALRRAPDGVDQDCDGHDG